MANTTHTPESIADARRFVLTTLSTLRSMQECLPDGQWAEAQEILDYIREERPSPESEDWLDLKADLQQNLDWWV